MIKRENLEIHDLNRPVSLLRSIGHTCGVQGQLSSGGALGFVAITVVPLWDGARTRRPASGSSRVRARNCKMLSGKNSALRDIKTSGEQRTG